MYNLSLLNFLNTKPLDIWIKIVRTENVFMNNKWKNHTKNYNHTRNEGNWWLRIICLFIVIICVYVTIQRIVSNNTV